MKKLLFTILLFLISNYIFCLSIVENPPQYKGGFENLHKYINTNAIYTAQAVKDSVEGRVIVQFIISRDGDILDPIIIKGIHHDLDSISLNLIKRMPRWKPGKQLGDSVKMRYTLPISFKLPSIETSKYWLNEGKRKFMKICSDQYILENNECDCWYKFILSNYNTLELYEIDLNEMIKFQDCKK